MGDMTVDLTRIQQIMSNGNYDEARPLLKEYLAANPNDVARRAPVWQYFRLSGFFSAKTKKIWHDTCCKVSRKCRPAL